MYHTSETCTTSKPLAESWPWRRVNDYILKFSLNLYPRDRGFAFLVIEEHGVILYNRDNSGHSSRMMFKSMTMKKP